MVRSGNIISLLLLLTMSDSVMSAPLVSAFDKYKFYAKTKETKKGPNLYTGFDRSNEFGLYFNSQANFESKAYNHSLSTGLRRSIGSTQNILSFTAITSDYFDLASAKKTIKLDSEFKKFKTRYTLNQQSISHEAEGRFALFNTNIVSTLGESISRTADADNVYFVKMNAQYRIVDLAGKISTTSSKVDTRYFFKSLTRRRFGWTLRGELYFINTDAWESQGFNASLDMKQVDLYVEYKQKLPHQLQKTRSGVFKLKRGIGKLNLAFEVEFADGEYKDSKLVMMLPQLNLD
ncbi:MAG: hypothetical protein GXP14_17440 [Gammaproteobacteria bacterium]|nr:hypothetical protein [Gammaproteobacteria bacterium]